MEERYIRVFSAEENLYTEDSPIVISAGALLKDNYAGKMLAQLKFKSITPKVIKALKITIYEYDTVGAPLEGSVFYEYLDLSVSRGSEFGQKVPITLSNSSTRSFSIAVNEVVFSDNSAWSGADKVWEPLKKARSLVNILKDSELIKQFKIEYGGKCESEAIADRDIWICSCGKINKNTEDSCYDCGCFLSTLKSYNISLLEEHKNTRVEKERIEAELKQKDMVKKGLILTGAIIILIIISSMCSSYNKKLERYNKALALISSSYESDYEDGIDQLKRLGGFKDSEEQIYLKAVELTNEDDPYGVSLLKEFGDYKDSKEVLYQSAKRNMVTNPSYSLGIFEYLNDYKDSKDKIAEVPYSVAENAMQKANYSLAYENYEKAGDYKDSKKKMKEAYLLDTALVHKFSEKTNVSDLKFDAKDMTEEEIKSIIIDSWYFRTSTPSYYHTFNEDGTYSRKYYTSKWHDSNSTHTWVIENGELKLTTTTTKSNNEVTTTTVSYKLRKIADGVLLAYDSETNTVYGIYFSENAELTNNLFKKYPGYKIFKAE